MEWQSITMWDCNSLSVFEHVKVFNHCQSGTFCRKRRCSYQEREVGNYKVTGETSTLGRSVHNIVQKKKKLFLYYTHLPLATVVVHSPMGTASLTTFCVQATDKEVRTHARMTSPPLYTYQGRGNHGDTSPPLYTYQGRGNHGDTNSASYLSVSTIRKSREWTKVIVNHKLQTNRVHCKTTCKKAICTSLRPIKHQGHNIGGSHKPFWK